MLKFKNREKFILPKDKAEMIINRVIKEELGSFKNQYDYAKILTKVINKMHNFSVYRHITDFPNSDDIKHVDLAITPNKAMMQFVNFEPSSKTVYVEIDECAIQEAESIENLASQIAHELMHGNVYLKIGTDIPVDPVDITWIYYLGASQGS